MGGDFSEPPGNDKKEMKHRHPYIILCLAASGLLSGCGIYTRYSRPALEVNADSLYRATPADTDSVTLPSKSWRELFTDPCLQTLIATGLERNTELGIARLQTEEAQAVLQNARRAAAASLEQSRAYAQAVETQLVATIAESYYTLLMLDEQLAISSATLENWDETIATLEALVQAGRANDVAVRQARASRAALRASMLTISRSISETENALSALLKEPAHAISRGTLADQRFPDSMSVCLPLSLLSNRPDVRQAEAALAGSFYATNDARAAFYPALTLSGSLGWTNNGGGSILNPGKWLSSAVASLTAPLFNKGTNIANLKVAEAQQQEALLRFEQKLLTAGNEVNDALAEWQTADGRISNDLQQTADLEAAAENTLLLVRYTSANYLEVLTAQQSLLAARLTLAQDRISRILAVVHLYHALGGGRESVS